MNFIPPIFSCFIDFSSFCQKLLQHFIAIRCEASAAGVLLDRAGGFENMALSVK
jgi:hypothetical protein